MFARTLIAALLLATSLSAQSTPFWGAAESRPPETPTVALKPGEFVWNPAAASEGPVVVLVSLGEQRAYVYRNAVEIGVATISTGKGGYETPTGVFIVLQKDKDHHSSKYNNAAMPYTQRLTWSGVALHAGGLPGFPSSHGCVHLPSRFSQELFAISPMGMTVVVVDERTAPQAVAHPPAFAPIDSRTGAVVVPERLADEKEFRLEPEKSEHGPVSIVISTYDRRALVLRNGVEIGRAKLSLRDPGTSLGTHAYVLTEGYDDTSEASLPGHRQGKWLAIGIPGHFDDAGRISSFDAASAVVLPEGFSRAVYLLLGPGSTMMITDAPILAENTASGFTILSDGPSQAATR